MLSEYFTLARKVPLFFVVGILGALLICGVDLILKNHGLTTRSHIAKKSLPSDVDSVADDFHFHYDKAGLAIELNGKRMIRRGEMFLGVRSGVMKRNFLHNVDGSCRRGSNKVIFKAQEAEWDMKVNAPLTLKQVSWVCINSEKLNDVGQVRINFQKGIVTVYGEQRKDFLIH